jgi:hypothetical protein
VNLAALHAQVHVIDGDKALELFDEIPGFKDGVAGHLEGSVSFGGCFKLYKVGHCETGASLFASWLSRGLSRWCLQIASLSHFSSRHGAKPNQCCLQGYGAT